MAEKRSVTQILYPHPHRRPCTPGQMPIPSCELKTRKHVNVISYAEWKEESLLGTVEFRGVGEVRRHVELGLRRKMEYRSVPVRFLPSTPPPPPPPRSRGINQLLRSRMLACLLGCWVGTYVHPPKLSVIELTVPYLPRIPHLHPRSS